MKCAACDSSDIDYSDSSTSCRNCGLVIEESQIVSDVTFAENSAGGAVVQGSYVSNEQRGARTQGPGGYRSGGVGASREQTLMNARLAIKAMGLAKRVPQAAVDKAARLFQLALEGGTFKADGPQPKNFVLGRKSEYTQASCLYVACRMEKTHHMLIDFADAISVNVFVLGRSYLRLVRCLGFRIPVIDPSIYISRFASLLDFGDETQRVATDATRLVQRFNKDWITHGRRPAGICGACLLIAARMNNFRRSVAEVVQIVKIADVTLRKRLEDFRNTPSGKLSIDDFRSIWLEEENEPPAYYLARMPKKPKRMKGEGSRSKKYKEGEEEGEDEWGEEGGEGDDEGGEVDGETNAKEETQSQIDPMLEALADEATTEEITRYLDDPAANGPENAVASGSGTTTAQTSKPETIDEDLADLDEEELDAFILSEAEVKIKERVWVEFNKEYLEKTLERQLKMEADIKAGIGPKPPKRKRVKVRDASNAPSTAAESATQMMQQRKFSKRLNYDMINKLFDDNHDVKSRKNADSDLEDDDRSGKGSAAFQSDAEDVIEERGNSLPSNHPSVRKRSRLEVKDRARKAKARALSSAGEESGTERGASRPLTDADTDTEGNNWKSGLSMFGNRHGDDDDDDDDYGDAFDDGDGILD
ncbi:hypothetical protein CBS101457_002750 [Exobasidium rhododendri]|nr:hypothetical protein CBS101457_002750 [Exobasidium rhododendri]